MEVDSNTLLKVMSVFNFASDGFETHPLRDRKFYNHVTETLNKIFYLDWKESIDYTDSRILANRPGMPIYAFGKQIVEQNVIEIEMENPMLVALKEINCSCLNISHMIPVMVIEYRKCVKQITKDNPIFNNSIQSNMKTYFNLFYGSVDAKNSIIRSTNGFSFHENISREFMNLIDRLTQDIASRDILYYDTDTVYIRAGDGRCNQKIIADNLICLNAAYTLNAQVKTFDHLIINRKKSVIRFNGNITDLVVGNEAEMLGC